MSRILLAGLLIFLAAALWMAVGGTSGLSTNPSSRPTSQPTTQPVYPSEDLIVACRRSERKLTKKLDGSFSMGVWPPFIVAGNMPKGQLDYYARRSVVGPAEVMWRSYFRHKPDKVITVLLFTDDRSYRTWANRLYGDKDLPHFGYYRHENRTLVMNIATGTGTLVHELTHALIDFDFPDVPLWFNEGLACLHEQCQVGKEQIVGLTNWRLSGLQRAIRTGKLRPLRQLVTQRDFYGPQQGLNYAQSRYFVMYMQHGGLLGKFYEHFRKNHTASAADAKAIEDVFGQSLENVEQDFLKWVMKLRYP